MTDAAAAIPGGERIGDFQILGKLGAGGMGVVYKATDLRLERTVALKFLPAGVAGNDSRLAQFHNELRVARQVSHKNVVRLYDLGDADGALGEQKVGDSRSRDATAGACASPQTLRASRVARNFPGYAITSSVAYALQAREEGQQA